MTIHDDIDTYLVADLHDELSDEERNALHSHLVECAGCRKTHQETKTMNKALEEKFAYEKTDAAFEQRMLAGFRNRIPQKTGGVAKFVVDLMRLRATQIAAVAAILLALVQVGRMITGEGVATSRERDYEGQVAYLGRAQQQQQTGRPAKALLSALGGVNALDKSSQLAAERPDSYAREEASVAPAAPPANAAEQKEETRTYVTKAAEAKTGAQAAAKSVAELATPPNAPVESSRKLIRNAKVDLEVISFDDVVQKITAFASEERGYVATSGSQKQANGKLRGDVVVKVLPENLDRFLQKVRGLGELKNQTIGTQDVTKAYFDTDARLKNAHVMEQRLIDMLKTKTGKVSDLLQVEKELGRVREEIEKMQGDLKFWDSQIQFATVTISLSEKDLEEPAAFLLKERAQLALYTAEVEKAYNDLKALASSKVQITNAQLDRDNTGRVSSRVSMLIAPEESDGVIAKAKAMGRVENFQTQTERIAQGGQGMSENAKTKRDKVELNITISRDEQEQALQQTSLRIRTGSVDEKAKQLRGLVEKQNGRVRSSTFSRDPNGREFADVMLRVPMKGYAALMQSLDSLGKVEDVSVQRQEHPDAQLDEANAPADLSIQVYSQGNIVSQDTGLIATLRRTIAQSAAAIMWSLRMIGVAIAFLAPWAIALVGVIWITRRIARARNKT